jgi:hypothetical protein
MANPGKHTRYHATPALDVRTVATRAIAAATATQPVPANMLAQATEQEQLAAVAYARAEKALRNAHAGAGVLSREDMANLETRRASRLAEWQLAKATVKYLEAKGV